MRSPAWTRQRSLAIITFDEDNYDHQHPAQRVATIVLDSQGVRPGFVSTTRYTHYSLLRTIEGARAGTLTANDRFAQPVNDIFSNAPSRPALATNAAGPAGGSVTPVSMTTRKAGDAIGVGADPDAIAITPDGRTALVVNYGSDTVTPIRVGTRRRR